MPEQLWDAADLPKRGLFLGRPSGSAMPFAWAHAEYLKLDTPPQPVRRYQVQRQASPHAIWRFNHKCTELPAGLQLRIEFLDPAVVRWTHDGWRTSVDAPARDTGMGTHVADLPTDQLPEGTRVEFTFHWPGADRWEGTDFAITVSEAGSSITGDHR